PGSGTHNWFNYRIVVKLHAKGQTLKSFVDSGPGESGRATAWMILHGAYTPIPSSVEAELVRLVIGPNGTPAALTSYTPALSANKQSEGRARLGVFRFPGRRRSAGRRRRGVQRAKWQP